MRRYDIVLLDADNTLFDFNAAEAQALEAVLAEFGWPCDAESKRAYLEINHALWTAFDRGEAEEGFLTVERFRRLGEHLGRSADPAEMNRRYLDHLGECGLLLPGAEDLCRTLREAGCRLALATNGVARVQYARLAGSPLAPYLERLFISGEMGTRKPEPAFFRAALSAMGAEDMSRCVMVGDGLGSDVKGALSVGLDVIWFAPGGGTAPADLTPTYTARSLAEIGRIICQSPRSTERGDSGHV